MAKLDLKPQQVGVLSALNHYPAFSQLELAKLMGVAPSLMVAMADHLEEVGAITRSRDPGDRRRQVLTLTAQGEHLLDQCRAAALQLEREYMATLTPGDMQALRCGLSALSAAFGLSGREPHD